MAAADFGYDFGRDYRLDRVGILGHSGLLVCGDDVVEQQCADLIAGQADEFAGLIARHYTHAVGVRVGRDDKVAAHLFGELDSQLEYLRILGVRKIDRREIAVERHLLLDRIDVLESDPLQCLGYELVARAVQRCVDDLEVVRDLCHNLWVDRLSEDIFKIYFVELVGNVFDNTRSQRVLELHLLHVVENIGCGDEFGHRLGMIGRELRAVLPVRLVAVVLLRIVRCGDVDSGYAMKLAHRERQYRSRANAAEQVNLDAVRGEHARGGFGEQARVVAAVAADRDAHFGFAFFVDEVGESLRRVRHCVDVHRVCTGYHRAAQSAGTELQVLDKPELDLLIVVSDGAKLGFCRLIDFV